MAAKKSTPEVRTPKDPPICAMHDIEMWLDDGEEAMWPVWRCRMPKCTQVLQTDGSDGSAPREAAQMAVTKKKMLKPGEPKIAPGTTRLLIESNPSGDSTYILQQWDGPLIGWRNMDISNHVDTVIDANSDVVSLVLIFKDVTWQ